MQTKTSLDVRPLAPLKIGKASPMPPRPCGPERFALGKGIHCWSERFPEFGPIPLMPCQSAQEECTMLGLLLFQFFGRVCIGNAAAKLQLSFLFEHGLHPEAVSWLLFSPALTHVLQDAGSKRACPVS